MSSTKKFAISLAAAVARLLIGAIAVITLAAPALAQSVFSRTYCTFTQGGWGAAPSGNNPGTILANNFSSVYPGGFVEVGISGTSGFSMKFTSSTAVEKYLPAGGQANALAKDYTNPTKIESGVFGGQVLALQLNVDFDDKLVIGDGLSPAFGDLVFHDTDPMFDGKTVREVLDVANLALGGALPAGYAIRGGTANLNDIVSSLNQGFDNCNPSDNFSWANAHLMEANGCPPEGCPPPPPPA
jgi:hypothetical protein